MCGINGFQTPAPVPVEGWFAEAIRTVVHRGPDGAGYWLGGDSTCRPLAEIRRDGPRPASVALGFSRLAILDLTPAANQPFVVPGRAAMAYNGEIYNYLEIRRDLEDLGWQFTSTGDTEVLIKAYLQWGTDALRRLDGMWAFAIHDQRDGSMLLSRDRFGEKPLFWTEWEGGVAFASEVKQLLAYPGTRLRLDARLAAGFLVTGRPHKGASSWFEGIHQLEPGTWMRIGREAVERASYFDLAGQVAAVDPERSPADWVARFDHAFSMSIRRRLRSDVPVGTSLSGGLDSSFVLATAVAHGHDAYQAFTLGSDDPHYDESGPAQRFAASQGVPWNLVWADPDEFSGLWDRITQHQESPVMSTSLYGQWKVFETARRAGVVVVLDGQGGDEVLGGYNKFVASVLWQTARSHPRRLLAPATGFVRQVGTIRNLRSAGYRYLGRFGNAPRAGRFLRPGLFEGEAAPRVRVDPLDQRLQDITTWSLPNLLTYADRNAMAHSIETRLPYLDADVVALGLAMPVDVLFRDGWTKWPLRVSLAARAGVAPAWSPGKRWFGVPQERWLSGALDPAVRAWHDDPHPAWDEIVDRDALRAFQDAWRTRRASYAWNDQVFKLVSLDRFLRVWFGGTTGATAATVAPSGH
jgi:asparagine synthase (glutamine-hydrolysing)